MFKLDLEKAKEDIKLPTPVGSSKKQVKKKEKEKQKANEFQENIYFCLIGYAKVFDCVGHKCGKFFKRWEYQPPDLPLEKSVCRSRINS